MRALCRRSMLVRMTLELLPGRGVPPLPRDGWAFIAVTNDATQQVTAITPQVR